MDFYRWILVVFVVGNVTVFTAFMRITSLPWNAALLFFGYVYTNAPVVVSVFAARWADNTLKGHWLNWLNIFVPIAVGSTGLLAYSLLSLKPDAHPNIFFFGPLLTTVLWFELFAVLILIYVFVPDR